MPTQGLTATSTPRRVSPANTIISIRLKTKYALPVASRFELHSVGGFRLQNGALQVETIAGYCHLRNALKTYWLDQVESLHTISGEPIGNLASWLDERHAEIPTDVLPPRPDSGHNGAGDGCDYVALAAPLKRHRHSVSRSIDKAIDAAVSNGFADIADRLRGIRSMLADESLYQAGKLEQV